MKGSIVVEYIGQTITMSEATKREEKYAANDITVTVFKLGTNLFIDGHRSRDGECLMMEDNPAVWINHCKSSPNYVPKCVKVNGRCHLLIMATTDIPEGLELLYDYGDTRHCLET